MNNETLNNFNDINYAPLRTYNRVVMCHNLLEDSGKSAVEQYLSQFNESDRKQMYVMQIYISKVGPEKAKKEVTKGLTVVDNADE